MYRVIFHLDDENNVGTVYRNIMNLIKDMKSEDEEVKIQLLANGSGVKPFMKEKKENRQGINTLLDNKVEIALCNNSLRVLYLGEEDFIEEAIIVKSAVGELTRKQHEGWAYIKP